MSNEIKQQFGVVYGSIDNPVLADIPEGLEASTTGIQWPTQPAASGRIIEDGFSKHQKAMKVRSHIAYRFNRQTDKKRVLEWTDVQESDSSWGITIAHSGVLQYERLNFVAPVLASWEPGLRNWGKRYEKGVSLYDPDSPKIYTKSIPGKNYSVDLLLRSHKGSWNDTQAYKLGSEKNYPLMVGYPRITGSGYLPEEKSLIRLDQESVILTVLKKKEFGTGYIARLYEASDTDHQVEIKFNLGKEIEVITRTNLLEDEIERLEINKNKVTISIRGFGIETLGFLTTKKHQ